MRIFKDDKVNQVNVLDERFYTMDNKTFYPSVTTVLNVYPKGYGYQDWLKQVGYNADIVVTKAAEQGSNVHNAIEDFLNGKELVWIDDAGKENFTFKEWSMISKFMEFYEKYIANDPGNEVLGIEYTAFSDKMKLGGTVDLVCRIDGEIWIIDHKTSNALYVTNQMQLACYKEMWDEKNPDQKIDRYGILWLNSSHRTEKQFQGVGWVLAEFTKKHDHNLKLYNHTRALWDEENPNYKPKNLSFKNSFKK